MPTSLEEARKTVPVLESDKEKEDYNVLRDVAQFFGSAANSALFGIPEVAGKAIAENTGSNLWNEYKAAKEKYKAGATIGEIAGYLTPLGAPGAVLKPVGGVISKVAPKVGEAIEGVGKFLARPTQREGVGAVAARVAKGTGQVLEQEIPRAASRLYTETESTSELPAKLGEEAIKLVIGAPIGGAANAILSPLSKKVGDFISGRRYTDKLNPKDPTNKTYAESIEDKKGNPIEPENFIKKKLTDDAEEYAAKQTLKRMGVSNVDLLRQFGGKGKFFQQGRAVREGEGFVKDLAEYGRKNQLGDERGQDVWESGINKFYDDIYNKTSPELTISKVKTPSVDSDAVRADVVARNPFNEDPKDPEYKELLEIWNDRIDLETNRTVSSIMSKLTSQQNSSQGRQAAFTWIPKEDFSPLGVIREIPEVKSLYNSAPEATRDSWVSEVVSGIDKQTNIQAKKKLVNKYFELGMKGQDMKSLFQKELAEHVDDYLDDQIFKAAEKLPGYTEKFIKEKRADYPLEKILMRAIGRDKLNISVGAAPGSDTAAKILTQSVLGAGAGSGIGALTGDDENKGTATLIGGGIGLIGGNVLNKQAKRLYDYLAEKSAQGVSTVAKNIFGDAKDVETIAKLRNAILPALQKAQDSKLGKGIKWYAKETTGQPIKATVPAAAAVSLVPEVEQEVKENEAAASDKQIQQAKRKISPYMASRLADVYNKEYVDQLSVQEFVARMKKKTNNFDPALSASLLYDTSREQEEFLKLYNAYLTTKGMNVPKLAKAKKGSFFGLGGSSEQDLKQRKLLVETLANLATSSPERKPSVINNISNELDMIAEYPELIQTFLSKFGLNWQELKRIGVIE